MLDKTFDPKAVETRQSERWDKAEIGRPTGNGTPFTVIIHIAHFRRLQARILQRRTHAALCARALRSNARHVIRVRAHAIANHLGQNLRAAFLRKLKLFENQNARAFANHKAIAILVEGPARPRRLVVARRERAHGSESAHRQRRDRSL